MVATWLTTWFRKRHSRRPVERARRHPQRVLLRLEGLEDRCLLSSNAYLVTNLVSDQPGVAKFQDTNLVNAWGLDAGPGGPWWVADNGTGVSTLYNGNTGQPIPLVVTIPPPAGSPAGTTSAPTGLVFNGTGQFAVSEGGNSGSAFFIFATEDGTISGWNPGVDLTHAILAVDNSASGAVYKGLALGSNASGNFLFATNFRAGTIDVFDSNFDQVSLSGSFSDPSLPPGYAPFGIRDINGQLYVTYALQNAEKHDDVAGPAHGFVDVFDTDGNLERRLITRGHLNSPWGLALAPADFGKFSNDLLVGNFGNGRINAYDPTSGEFEGTLSTRPGRPIVIDGLWALSFGNGTAAGPTNTLFFTSGPDDESHGLFGSITLNAKGDHDDHDDDHDGGHSGNDARGMARLNLNALANAVIDRLHMSTGSDQTHSSTDGSGAGESGTARNDALLAAFFGGSQPMLGVSTSLGSSTPSHGAAFDGDGLTHSPFDT